MDCDTGWPPQFDRLQASASALCTRADEPSEPGAVGGKLIAQTGSSICFEFFQKGVSQNITARNPMTPRNARTS